MSVKKINWPSVIVVLFFLALSVGAIAGWRASGNSALFFVAVPAAVVGAALVLVLKIEKPAHFAKIPQVVSVLWVFIGGAVITFVKWGPWSGVVAGAAFGAILSLTLGWTYAQSLWQSTRSSD